MVGRLKFGKGLIAMSITKQIHIKQGISIADYQQPYIIAEIGANHNGDMDLARHMIKAAKQCGCDAVKFQSWGPASLICREEYARNTKYADSPKKHFGSLQDMVEKYYLRPKQHEELKAYCDELGIDFCSTPFTKTETDLLCQIDVPFLKVASMDVNNLLLLRYIAQTKKPIFLSTGMATLFEIETAVKTIESEGNQQIVLLHCVSLYPPKLEDVHLNNMKMLRQAFGYPVGFSDHTFGSSIPLAAVALGACVIEKHFTTDKELPGWDHEISADINEMSAIVDGSRSICSALGGFQRTVSKEEEAKKLKFRRSLVASRDLKAGEVLKKEDVDAKRPGNGISPDKLQYVIGRLLKRDVEYDQVISWDDFN